VPDADSPFRPVRRRDCYLLLDRPLTITRKNVDRYASRF
jgi:hypothetical protein